MLLTLRLFAALELDEDARRRLAKVAADLRRIPGVRWTKPESLHLTLRFFGEYPEERLPELTTALEQVETPGSAIPVELERLSFLPGEHEPRIFVAVGQTPEPLARLQVGIEQAARSLGFEPERRGFLTHVTLGRVRDPRQGRKLVAAASEYEADLGAFVADHWTLYGSQLTPEGPIYSVLALWPFS